MSPVRTRTIFPRVGQTRLAAVWPAWRPWVLKAYRLLALAAIVWLLRAHYVWLRNREDRPITVSEVRELLPQAEGLIVDPGPERGRFVVDARGSRIGYALHTSPYADSIIGYSGPTDTLLVFNPDRQLLGVRLRYSWDTFTHGQDVATDKYFLKSFNGMGWDELAGLDIEAAGIEGVSGATMTSLCLVESMKYRVGQAVQQNIPPPRRLQIAAGDVGIAIVVAVAMAFTFTRLARRRWLRRAYQFAAIGYLGFYLGDMLALPLLVGWSQSTVPWHAAPGLVLLVSAAFVLPWATRRPAYCAHICPHGAAELLGASSTANRGSPQVSIAGCGGCRCCCWVLP